MERITIYLKTGHQVFITGKDSIVMHKSYEYIKTCLREEKGWFEIKNNQRTLIHVDNVSYVMTQNSVDDGSNENKKPIIEEKPKEEICDSKKGIFGRWRVKE